MAQFLAIVRGAPASGKTTIAKKFRSFDKKVVWLKVDNFKDFFTGEASLKEQRYVDECALASLEYLLKEGFSVIMEKIFFDPFIIPKSIEVAEKHKVNVKVFQIRCPLETLLERDKNRPGVKEGCRKPLGTELITKLYNQLERTYYPDAIEIDTGSLSLDESVKVIKTALDIS
jgi:predicted kinase